MTGSQLPRICVEPPRVSTDGGDAALLMAEYGCELDLWQRAILDCWLGRDETGAYSMLSGGLALPRQNGKNVCIEAREFYGMIVNAECILHTAHQTRTSKKSFRRLVRMFTDQRHPEIAAIVRNVRFTNGEEAIELDNGGAITFSARSRQAARGLDGISLVVYDEAQELTDDQVEAVTATLSASPTGTRQVIYAGTPPYPGCPGTVFRRLRTSIETEPGRFNAWHEWSVVASSIDEINTTDRTLWYATNPAMGVRLSETFTAETELTTLTADGFARERLGWWAPEIIAGQDAAIDAAAWARCGSSAPKPEGKTAYGVKFSPDGGEVVLAGAVCPKDGPARITMLQRRPTGEGIQWLAEWLNERPDRASCVVIDGRNGVDLLVERIKGCWRAKNSVIRPRLREVVAAVSLLTTEIAEQSVTWYNEQTALAASALSCSKRPLAGGWAFGGPDAAPIEACALALWGARTSKRDPTKKMKIG